MVESAFPHGSFDLPKSALNSALRRRRLERDGPQLIRKPIVLKRPTNRYPMHAGQTA
jgi:hypothetical protein